MERFDNSDLDDAMIHLSTMKYWRIDSDSKAAIRFFLAKICISKESLEWLIETLVDRVGEWPGTKEVRGIYCTRFKPADGKEAACSLQGFTAEEIESQAIEDHYGRKQLTGQRTRKVIEGDVMEILPEVPSMPEIEEMRAAVREASAKRLACRTLAIDPKDAAKALEGLKKQGFA